MTQIQFKNRWVWVTGAGQGIGRHLACAFTELGANVIGLDRHFPQDTYPYRTQVLDISQPEDVENLCQQLLAVQPRLDILVNVAGILCLGELETLSTEDWRRCYEVNVSGTFYLLRQLIPVFKRQRSGTLVTVASNAAHVPRVGMAAYGASKAALVSLSHSVGLELAPFGVRSNVVSPGSTYTPMLRSMLEDSEAAHRLIQGLPERYKLGIPLGKIATEQDISNTILFLASDLAGHITLQDIVVDGGATLGA
ncbi:2,3-dihydro-2,3-dihydroxybenzoate dehydrogenase [Shewanella sp. AS16]|uniref:2,3-dihydro-2,3-dihydroxybenzoate dehydrogenase n=1 Tax=Shewanella sp. AS16 TaxID=2907625 RepID=UPI001F1B88D3|nr:2,3-dihydro-2,3-dihydroxybenzoate dehydrogenase [Shewanella sp. AS16]